MKTALQISLMILAAAFCGCSPKTSESGTTEEQYAQALRLEHELIRVKPGISEDEVIQTVGLNNWHYDNSTGIRSGGLPVVPGAEQEYQIWTSKTRRLSIVWALVDEADANAQGSFALDTARNVRMKRIFKGIHPESFEP